MAPGNVTQIDANYLNNLKKQLDVILTDVTNQLKGVGPSTQYPGVSWIPVVDKNLSVIAGPTGTPSFNAGVAFNTALGTMGGSVNQQLTWLQKTLRQMIDEITNTVNSFHGTESLNTETVDQLIQHFQNTIGSMNTPPGSSPPGSGGAPPGG